MMTKGNHHNRQIKKSVFRCALFACLAGAILALVGCGDKTPENAGTPAPGDKGHVAIYFPWKGQEVNPEIRVDYGEGDILAWLKPVDLTDNPSVSVPELLQDNPAVTMRLPLIYEQESVTIGFEESDDIIQIVSLEAYPLDEKGNLRFSYGKDHGVPFQKDGRNLYYSAVQCPDWSLSSAADPEAVYWPQGYILRCKINGWDKVYLFRIGVLIPRPENPEELDAIIPQEAGDAWDLSPFVLVEAQSGERPYGGGLYLMTDAERQELQSLLKPETWSVLENPEARGMDGAPHIVTLSETTLVMDGANRDGTVSIAIYNRYSEDRYIYTAPKEVLTAYLAFVRRMGDKVFPERFGGEV